MFPCMSLVFGKAISAFQRADGSVDVDTANDAALDYLYIAIALFAANYGSYFFLTTSAERQMKLLRTEALQRMLFTDIPWYDTHDAMQLSTRLTGDSVKIKDGMGSKLGEAIKYASQFAAGYVIGFIKGWDTELVMASVMPMLAISMVLLMTMIRTKIAESQQLYAEGGAIAEGTLGSIRTVASLNAEKRAIEAFRAKVQHVEDVTLQVVRRAALALGFFMSSTLLMYAFGLWYGGYRVSKDKATPMEVFRGFFGVLLGTIAIAMISPSLQVMTEARGAATGLYKILDTPSKIDASTNEGCVPATCTGRIEAVDLHFAYPSRLDAPILQGYNVTIEYRCVRRCQWRRQEYIDYNPQRGQLLLDEPVLFAQTIMENIMNDGENISREQAIEAAKLANAHNSIMSLPQLYETLVGDKGVSMSGGQKQRIAIARAIVRTQMTTLVIVHRLSTVRRADKIVVLSGGRVVEEGPHNDLMKIEGGVYNNLYTIQEGDAKKEAEAAVSTAVTAAPMLRQRSGRLSRSDDEHAMRTEHEQDGEDTKKTKFTVMDAMELSRPERKLFTIGAIAAEFTGFAMPGSAL